MPILAGVGNMSYRVFLIYNLAGGFIWSAALILLGYFFGKIIPEADRYLLPIIVVIVLISVLPGIVKFCRPKYIKSLWVRLKRP